MRRFIMGLLVLTSVACDQEPVLDDMGAGSAADAVIHALADEDQAAAASGGAEPVATVTVVSWVGQGAIRSKAHCADFVPDASLPGNDDCYCHDDPDLVGQINGNNGGDQCVLCRWWQWNNGDCNLDTSADVDLVFQTNGTSQYSYVDDGAVDNIEPGQPWTLGCSAGSCPCAGGNCSCSDSSLDFSVQRAHDGMIVSDPSSVLALTDCP